MSKLKKGTYSIAQNGGHSHLFNGRHDIVFESRFITEILDILHNSKANQVDTRNYQVQ